MGVIITYKRLGCSMTLRVICSDFVSHTICRKPTVVARRYCQVPTLVPKPGSPTVTQGNLPDRKSDALRALALSWVMLDCETRGLKIRVSVVQPSRAAATDARSAPEGRAKRVHSAPLATRFNKAP